MKRCSQGHYYDPDKHHSCPACRIPDLVIDKTRVREPDKFLPDDTLSPEMPSCDGSIQDTRRADNLSPGHPEDLHTVGLVRKKTGIDPVVGWLVCIEGPDKGRDYRIRSEKNFIGRSPAMDISIQHDSAVSRENHAVVSFDPKNNRFKIHPGEGHGLIYLKNETVDIPMVLTPYDVIELGETKLMFLPLCGERFQW